MKEKINKLEGLYKVNGRWTEKAKEKMRQTALKQIKKGNRKGLFEEGHKKGMTGKKHSPITKSKISKSNIGKNKGRVSYWKGKKNETTRVRNILNNPMKKEEVKLKVALKSKGKHYSRDTEFKENQFSGSRHYNWLGGKSFEPYSIDFNKQFKREIRKRDNQICILCGVHREKLNRALCIHHINYDKNLSIPENCISLCLSCHVKTNYNRKYWTELFQNLLSERYGYNYKECLIELNFSDSVKN